MSQTLFAPISLAAALDRLGFVQADPIRCPARAQDLTLRHRVRDYRAGDLEAHYRQLNVEEGTLYAYGFLPRANWELLAPRDAAPITPLEREVLEAVQDAGANPVDAGDLEKRVASRRVVNAWGGRSRESSLVLQRLHHRGLLRVAERRNGVRRYQVATPTSRNLPAMTHFRLLLLMTTRVLAPLPARTLRSLAARLRQRVPAIKDHCAAIDALIRGGELETQRVEGIDYIWLAEGLSDGSPPRAVRFLAPFDPLVWDRERFAQLWGWDYRFEAYTPAAKRVRGYYALPMLYGDRVLGWCNASVAGSELQITLGFVDNRPEEPHFCRELEAEVERLRTFLRLDGTR